MFRAPPPLRHTHATSNPGSAPGSTATLPPPVAKDAAAAAALDGPLDWTALGFPDPYRVRCRVFRTALCPSR